MGILVLTTSRVYGIRQPDYPPMLYDGLVALPARRFNRREARLP